MAVWTANKLGWTNRSQAGFAFLCHVRCVCVCWMTRLALENNICAADSRSFRFNVHMPWHRKRSFVNLAYVFSYSVLLLTLGCGGRRSHSKFLQLRIQSCRRYSLFKSGMVRNVARCASPIDGISASLFSSLPVHLAPSSSQSSSVKTWDVSWTVNQSLVVVWSTLLCPHITCCWLALDIKTNSFKPVGHLR